MFLGKSLPKNSSRTKTSFSVSLSPSVDWTSAAEAQKFQSTWQARLHSCQSPYPKYCSTSIILEIMIHCNTVKIGYRYQASQTIVFFGKLFMYTLLCSSLVSKGSIYSVISTLKYSCCDLVSSDWLHSYIYLKAVLLFSWISKNTNF